MSSRRGGLAGTSACRELPPPLRLAPATREYTQALASPPVIHGLSSPQPLASPPARAMSPFFPPQQSSEQVQPAEQAQPVALPPAAPPPAAHPPAPSTRRTAVPRRLLSSSTAAPSPTLKVGKYTVHAATATSPSFAVHPGIDGRLVVVVVPRHQLDATTVRLAPSLSMFRQ